MKDPYTSIPFGKYKGIPLGDVPYLYLCALIRNVPIKSNKLKEEIKNAIRLHEDGLRGLYDES